MTNPLVGLRLKALREERNINQDELAKLLGLKDRQTISAIENGDRRAKAEELSAVISHYHLDADYFTDPFRLVGEGKFSWRQNDCSPESLNAYQKRAGSWLAAFRSLSTESERPGPRQRLSLKLSQNSTFEQAAAEGERITVDFQMGDIPASNLTRVMENDFGILVLMVDMDKGISGAACSLPEVDAVLVNRNESLGRRSFDTAHEFFHILTWDAMPPKPVEDAREKGGNRVEQLANSFASALLMPRRLLQKFGEWQRLGEAERAHRLRTVAEYFQVSVSALHWRLVAVRLLTAGSKIPEVAASDYQSKKPPLFSLAFVKVISTSIEQGRISASRAAKLLDLSREALRDLFAAHGVATPVTV